MSQSTAGRRLCQDLDDQSSFSNSARMIRRFSVAERTAASTIARLCTLLCASDVEGSPVRTQCTNSASEPSVSSASSPTRTSRTGSPTRGAWSPSQVAVPNSPLTRQRLFHEVSWPGLHQLPLKTNRASPGNSKIAVAAASPANQLQPGLYDSQYTETGSSPSSARAESNWWIAMSTSSGYGISSRKPPKCGAFANSQETVAIGPSPATASRSAVNWLRYRRDWLIIRSLPVSFATSAIRWASATVGAIGFSQSTGSPARSASSFTGLCAAGTVTLTTASAPTTSTSSDSDLATGTTAASSSSLTRWASSRSRSTRPTSSVSADLPSVCSQVCPIAPAPTWITRSGSAAFLTLGSDTEVPHRVPLECRRLPLRPIGDRPGDPVGDHLPHVLVVVHRVLLVARGEVEDPAVAAAERAAAAEHLATAEVADEDQFVGHRDVEELAVHLLRLDLDRLWHTLRDRMSRVDGPDELAVSLVAPAQRATRTHQPAEDLRPVTRVQHDQPETGQHVLLHPLDHLVGHVLMRHVTPPDQHVGACEDLVGQSVLGLVEGGRPDREPVAEVLLDAFLDRGVHAVRVELGDPLVAVLVPVLAPDEDARVGGHSSPFDQTVKRLT